MSERGSPLRQGGLLSQADAVDVGLLKASEYDRCVVILSHDCDLSNPMEPYVEVAVAEIVEVSDKQLTNARSPRKLHLIYDSASGRDFVIQVMHEQKKLIKRERAQHFQLRYNLSLSLEQKRVLKQWLAARYGRPAFPDAFENRLRKKVSKKDDLAKKISRIASQHAEHIVGVFFGLEEQRHQELSPDEPYFLTITLVYNSDEGAGEARESVEAAAREISDIFDSVYPDLDSKDVVKLDSCDAVADQMFSLADLNKVDQWRLEYISLEDSPQTEFIATGEWAIGS